MKLTELKYIVALAKEKHFGKAAEQCHVSQPTLSVAIKKLEDELGVTLFERSKTSVTATPLGEKIVSQAQKVLNESRMVKELAAAGKDQLSSPLKLGAILTIGPYLFPHLIPELHNQAADMPLYLEENYTGVLRKQLSEGELDAIIIALPFNEPDVVTRPLYDENFVAVFPKQHKWTELKNISADMLIDEDLLMLGEGHCFRDQVFEFCPALQNQHHSMLGSVLEGSSLETLKHMVASGLGVTVLPESAIANVDKSLLETRPFEAPAPARTVALAWRASFPRSKAIDLLINTTRQCRLSEVT